MAITALRHDPELLLVLRGIDVANVELAEPAWPLGPLFRLVRDASRREHGSRASGQGGRSPHSA